LASASALFLVIHGSRAPRPAQALQQLVGQVQRRLPANQLVAGGQLECGELSLDQQLLQFAQQVAAKGLKHVQVVPLFLLPGVHVKVDLPAAITATNTVLPAGLTLGLSTHLGAHPGLMIYFAQRMQQQNYPHRIILSHGSKRPGGNRPIADLAAKLEAIPAYWSVPPSLTTVVEQLVATGARQIGIFPYFLFPGTLGDAMIQTIDQLRQQFTTCDFWLDRPFDVSDELVDVILALAQEAGPELLPL
jgi:sirohydrochlorin ferrochelatase